MGLIGHHMVEHIHRHTNWNIVIFDKLSYASKGLERLRSNGLKDSKRISVYTIDLIQSISKGIALEIGKVDYIVHLAAETHVDNSISDPVPFIYNNVMSTVHMLEYARTLLNLKKFFYFSTDEVFGPAPGNIAYGKAEPQNIPNHLRRSVRCHEPA